MMNNNNIRLLGIEFIHYDNVDNWQPGYWALPTGFKYHQSLQSNWVNCNIEVVNIMLSASGSDSRKKLNNIFYNWILLWKKMKLNSFTSTQPQQNFSFEIS